MSISPILAAARAASIHAYSPYSGFRVGAAVQFAKSTQLYYGTNIENKSYGLTICAERTAIFAGVSLGYRDIETIALSCRNSNNEPIRSFFPCGACLQVIAEFGNPETVILIDGMGEYRLSQLLPQPFEF